MSVINSLIVKSAVAAYLAALPLPLQNQKCNDNCQLSDGGVAIIRTFEGYSPFVYKDSAGLDTIGYGHLITKNSPKFNIPLLPREADALLRKDTKIAVNAVNKAVTVPIKQHQADPLISFTFNVGGGAFAKSTLVKKINYNLHMETEKEFLRWNKAGGKPVTGLSNRRAAEAEIYNKKGK